ncbi:MAG: response regulator transcription factor [Phycisphaerae bacterium]|nr:response regulator transcription factor [Phycisphaerae bacterium]
MSIRIVLADDHQLFRDGLSALLAQEAELELVGEAANGRTAVELAGELAPDVVVMDISMSDLNGIEATRQIVQRTLATKVLALSMHSDRRFVEGMLQAGASGYLLKDCANEEFVRAIREVAAGRTYLSPAVAGQVVEEYVHGERAKAGALSRLLTAREREVLQLVAEGLRTKEIANRLHISSKTAETHRQQLMNKLNIHSVAELTKFAVREGLTSLDK